MLIISKELGRIALTNFDAAADLIKKSETKEKYVYIYRKQITDTAYKCILARVSRGGKWTPHESSRIMTPKHKERVRDLIDNNEKDILNAEYNVEEYIEKIFVQ